MDRRQQPSYSYYGAKPDTNASSMDDFGAHNNPAGFARGAGFDNPFADQSSAAAVDGSRHNHNTGHNRRTGFGSFGAGADEKETRMDAYAQKQSAKAVAGGGTGGEGNVAKGSHEHVEDLETTRSRRMWVLFTWILTFWIPSPFLSWCGRMQRPDVRMAWREKVAICVIIVFLWFLLLFIIIGLGLILCPKEYVWTLDDVSGHSTEKSSYVALRGSVYDITDFMRQKHGDSAYTATMDTFLLSYSGNDVNASFPLPVRVACPQFATAKSDPNYLFFYPVSGASEADPNQAN
ncbi:hypothetical protein LPJ71_000112, partial [Coemansia sp. S17]